MAVLDWTRTNLRYELPNKSLALRFDITDFAAYDIFILKRKDAKKNYGSKIYKKAEIVFNQFDENYIKKLENNIISGLPGGEGTYSRDEIILEIEKFTKLGTEGYRQNLFSFLKEVIPIAESSKVKMCIHPDDPPFSLFGLPCLLLTRQDFWK